LFKNNLNYKQTQQTHVITGDILKLKKALVLLALTSSILSSPLYANMFKGVNLSGAEFGSRKLPGKMYFNYIFPSTQEVQFFLDEGMNTFRLPFKWERIQNEMYGELNKKELSKIRDLVDYITLQNAYIILDVHNYARYYGKRIGDPELPIDAFSDLWAKLAAEFTNNDHVMLGLMNEPKGMETEVWLNAANAAIKSIREQGNYSTILVPGNGYTGAHSWHSNWYGTPNSEVLRHIEDPEDNYLIEAHQYFDGNSSGTSDQCVSETVGVSRLVAFTEWLQETGQKGFLGEFGVADNLVCLAALANMLEYIRNNDDVWEGWTYWSAGPWWGNYMFELPKEDTIKLEAIKGYL